jgi:prophage antirepressor-like protein
MSRIIEVFENLLKYNKKEVFIILDINNDIWFKMKDILRVLEYSSIKKAIYKLDINKKFKLKYKHIKMYPSRDTLINISSHPNTIFINESGLYQLLSNSTKPIASKFRDELFIDILPSIRKTGIYKIKAKDNKKLKKLNRKLKEEINYYEDKHIYKPTTNSYVYILKKNIGSKKCYKMRLCRDIQIILKKE